MQFLNILIVTFLLLPVNKLFSQVDCGSSTGIFALMAAPVILNPTDVDDVNGILTPGSLLIVRGNTKIFLNPPATISSTCINAISMFVFFSTSQAEVNGLPALATQNMATLFATKKNVQATLTATADRNVRSCSASLPKTGLIENQPIYYRWAKMINHPTSTDPIVWSSTLSLTVKSFSIAHMRFDVDLELDHMTVANVKDWDGTEDLLGSMNFYSLKAISRENNTKKGLWPPPHVSPFTLGKGTYQIHTRISLISNLTFEELRNIELQVGGFIEDDEGLAAPLPKPFKCDECEPILLPPFRALKFISFSTTQESIYNLVDNGTFQALKFAGDNFFELNYYENGVKANGWLKFMWKVWVKPHQ